MAFSNYVSRTIKKIYYLPRSLRERVLTFAVGRNVKMVGYCGIKVHTMTHDEVSVSIPNKTKTQNHIGGVHACATALLAETATGLVVGMNVQDACVNVLKSLNIEFLKRCEGGVRAKATLSDTQIQLIQTTEKGETVVPVQVLDAADKEIVSCEMIWAWIPKKRK